MCRIVLAALFALLIMAGPAVAIGTPGTLMVEGPMRIDGSPVGTAGLAGLLMLQPEAMTEFGASFPVAKVTIFERHYLEAGMLNLQSRPTSTNERELRGLVLTTSASPTSGGFVGLYPVDSERTTLAFRAAAAIESRLSTTLASAQGSPESGPDSSFYTRQFHEPHLLAEDAMRIDYRGAGALKILGPTIALRTAEGTTTERTGTWTTETGETIVRWVYVEFSTGAVVLDSGRTPMSAVLSSAVLNWNGRASFDQARGTIVSDGREYTASGGFTLLDGALSARLTPTTADGRALTFVDLDGRLVTTTMTAAAPSPFATTPKGWGLASLGTVLGGIGLLAVMMLRSRNTKYASGKEVLVLAHRAGAEERWTDALAWTYRARAVAPSDTDLILDEAFYLSKLGRFDDALKTYETASHLLPADGTPDHEAALISVLARRPLVEVERWIKRTLEKSPELAYEIEIEPEFDILQASESYRDLLASAYARAELDEEWTRANR